MFQLISFIHAHDSGQHKTQNTRGTHVSELTHSRSLAKPARSSNPQQARLVVLIAHLDVGALGDLRQPLLDELAVGMHGAALEAALGEARALLALPEEEGDLDVLAGRARRDGGMVEPRTEEAARAGGGAVVEVAVGAAHAHPRGLLVLLVWRQLDHDGVFDEVKVLRVLMRGEDAARNPSACETRVEARLETVALETETMVLETVAVVMRLETVELETRVETVALETRLETVWLETRVKAAAAWVRVNAAAEVTWAVAVA